MILKPRILSPFILSTLLSCIFSFNNTVSAQMNIGFIVNQNEEPIIGAIIENRTQGEFYYSDYNGIFVIEQLNIQDTLEVSHIAYSESEWIVESKEKEIKIMLTEEAVNLEELVITPKVDALHFISDIDIHTSFVNTSQDILSQVPGLFIGQHAGGGKAEQIFLRGFDIDHGTDLAIQVDDIPVNMVSHAHGQGYADLHFLIPETIEKIEFGKGPHYYNQGNFNTAGYVSFKTKNKVEDPFLRVELGDFATRRLVSMVPIVNDVNKNLYLANELYETDGYFESPQNLHRSNLMLNGFIRRSTKSQIGFSIKHFFSEWNASGQIPERAVKQNLISEFGAIDDTEGGRVMRTSFNLNHRYFLDHQSSWTNKFYYQKSSFLLYSNFTFFLNDPDFGDQIEQKENRHTYGMNSEYKKELLLGQKSLNFAIGADFRHDLINNIQLSNTFQKERILTRRAYGDINEFNTALYQKTDLELGNWMFSLASRLDIFRHGYQNFLSNTENSSWSQHFNPKLNVVYSPTPKAQFFAKLSKGFHSNDTRLLIDSKQGNPLPTAVGLDIGSTFQATTKWWINSSIWYLGLEQELVYVGDEAVVEVGDASRRIGLDLSMRYQYNDWIMAKSDFSWTYARFISGESQESYVPLAPDRTALLGLTLGKEDGWQFSLDVRYLADRPADEFNSLVATGYTLSDMSLTIPVKKIRFDFQVRNVFNISWREAQFATESRLNNEIESVEEIHFTPGSPRFFKTGIEYVF